jgi:uncharacterized protein with PQ loop repeat
MEIVLYVFAIAFASIVLWFISGIIIGPLMIFLVCKLDNAFSKEKSSIPTFQNFEDFKEFCSIAALWGPLLIVLGIVTMVSLMIEIIKESKVIQIKIDTFLRPLYDMLPNNIKRDID